MAGSTRVFITRLIPEKGLDLLRKHCGVVDVFPGDRPIPRTTLERGARDADAILCLLSDRIGADIISCSRRLRVISNYAVGVDNIDIAAATGRGIVVTNTPGVLTEATAELTWALLFAVARRVVESDRFTRAGKFIGWGPMLMLGRDIQGKTLGIVGAGRIGQAVAERAGGMRMRILYSLSRRKPEFERKTGARRVGLRELLRKSDFVTFHVPLTPSTRHLIGRDEFALMKPTAYVVNASRGPVIDETALVEALRDKRIAGAGLDVYEEEPRLHPGLLALDNVVLLPHIGSATVETREKMAVIAARNVIDVLNGRRPEFVINPEALEARPSPLCS